jgi:predicted secreted protein
LKHSLKLLLLSLLFVAPFAAVAEGRDRVSLQSDATRAISNDLVQAVLVVEVEDRDPARLADAVNRTMTWALELAREAEDVDVRTGGYSTRPVYSKSVLTHWRGVQELHLETRDAAAVSRLIGAFQARLQVRSMNFTLSPERRREAENELIGEALGAFRQRVAVVEESLSARGHRIVNVDIMTPSNDYRPVLAMRAVAEDMAPPALEPGLTMLTVRVSGTVELVY